MVGNLTIDLPMHMLISLSVDEILLLYFDLLAQPKMPFQGDAPEGGDTF